MVAAEGSDQPAIAQAHTAFKILNAGFADLAMALQGVDEERRNLIKLLMLIVQRQPGHQILITEGELAAFEADLALTVERSHLGFLYRVEKPHANSPADHRHRDRRN